MQAGQNNILKQVTKLKHDLQKVLHFDKECKNIDFYVSSITQENPFNTTNEIKQWLKKLNSVQLFDVQKKPLASLQKWHFEEKTGNLVHNSGGFFSIKGLDVKTNIGHINNWTQPIIHQPEIGVLGIVVKKINGILYFLMQAKAEPGNLNTYQLSPTVQATRSNYLCLHGGKKTQYLNLFLDRSKANVLFDQLQSEQGARFYQKRNRNIIVEVSSDYKINPSQNFKWLTLGQILHLMKENNTINMDTRSIISGISYSPQNVNSSKTVVFEELYNCLNSNDIVTKPISKFGVEVAISAHKNSKPYHQLDTIIQKITDEKFKCEVNTKLVPLNTVKNWKTDDYEIYHEEKKFFTVLGVSVKANNREVYKWEQPIVKQQDEGLVGFVCKKINGVLHFLVQLKMECGVMDLLEMSPTVQCITGNYVGTNLPKFVNNFINNSFTKTIFDVYQSEEGGRFFEESNQNILVYDEEDKIDVNQPNNYIWLSMFQIKEFIKYNNFLNVEARSVIANINWS